MSVINQYRMMTENVRKITFSSPVHKQIVSEAISAIKLDRKSVIQDLLTKQRVYYRCGVCRILVLIEIEHQNDPSKQIREHDSQKYLINNGIIKQSKLLVQPDGNIMISCKKCETILGGITTPNLIYFFKTHTIINKIKYTVSTRQLQCSSDDLSSINTLYDRLRSYTSLTNHIIQAKLTEIENINLTQLHNKLNSFAKFYKHWSKRQI